MFFIPFSALMLVAGFGALVAGWRTPWRYRWLLCLPSIGILPLLILTVVAFWPINAALYYHGTGSPKDAITDAESVTMTSRWLALDWLRVAGATAAFVAPLRALALPWPRETVPTTLSWFAFFLHLPLPEWVLLSFGSLQASSELPTGSGVATTTQNVTFSAALRLSQLRTSSVDGSRVARVN